MNRRFTQPSSNEQLPQLAGLVKHNGFKDYESMLEQHVLRHGETIFIPMIHGSQAVVRSYRILDDERIDAGVWGRENPKKFLQGADWYYKR